MRKRVGSWEQKAEDAQFNSNKKKKKATKHKYAKLKERKKEPVTRAFKELKTNNIQIVIFFKNIIVRKKFIF